MEIFNDITSVYAAFVVASVALAAAKVFSLIYFR